MPLTSDDYNLFALGIAERFAQRANGLDDESRRLANIRPADHVLSGFLTPVPGARQEPATNSAPSDAAENRNGPPREDAIEDALTDDLPQDSAYEQTAIGLYWLAPRSGLHSGSQLRIAVRFHLYVRRLPTRSEQAAQGEWRRERRARTDAGTVAQGTPPPGAREPPVASSLGVDQSPMHADAVTVWTREEISLLALSPVDLGELSRRRRMTLDLSEQTRGALANCPRVGLFPGRREIQVPENATDSDDAYDEWLSRLPAGTLPDIWAPVVDIRLVGVPTDPTCARIALRLINRSQQIGRNGRYFVDPNLYAIRISACIPAVAHTPTIFRELARSFRYDRRMAGVGINCHVALATAEDQIILRTETTPITTVDRLEPRQVAEGAPTFETLEVDPEPTLRRILEDMRRYDADRWLTTVNALAGNERLEAEQARETFAQEIARFQRGIQLLSDPTYPTVRRAFALMNRAMSRAARGRFDRWHLFQIVFIVSQLPGLAAREYEVLHSDEDGDVDILWFAAGGGKTEAFLGLVLWQAFFDRLRGKRLGVAAFIRFPLRLLTFQQMQRLGAVLGAADLIRQQERLGGARFSTGYFVGRATTPNRIDDEMHQRFIASGPDNRLLRVFACPYCSSPTALGYDAANRLVEHRCTNRDCPGGGERLPIYVVDEDIYRFLPTVIVSTVDKLAQLGQNQRFAQLFGRFDLVCPVHGVSFRDSNRLCAAAVAFARGETPTTCDGGAVVTYAPFKAAAPTLLVQDELHLLTEELGTFDSHYETAAMEFARSLGAQPWKIVAATATIANYDVHAWQLYLRRARQFPGPGLMSFYYDRNPSRIGRIFVGVLGVGRKHTPVVTRVLSLMYLELQAVRDAIAADVASASRRYGLRPLTREDLTRLVFYYELILTYVLTRKGSDQVSEAIESRVKRELRELVPQHGELLVDTFNGGVTEAEMSAVVEQIRTAEPTGDPATRTRGIVTTNVIGHGIDVDRFNLIVFAGFPRLVAEYIQSSARVGRTYPGLSVFVATPQSERDRSVFDRFAKFHEYLDRLVDPSAITRWPEPALRRTVPGILSGYLMGIAASTVGERIWSVENVIDSRGRAGADAFDAAAIVEWMERAYGVASAPSSRYREELALTVQNHYSSIVNRLRSSGAMQTALNMHLAAMQSLRDTDDPAFITVGREPDVTILRRLIRG